MSIALRDMVLYTRQNRPAYDAWRGALEYLAFGVDSRTNRIQPESIVDAIKIEIDETPSLLFSSRAATLAAMYAMGYGRHRELVAAKMMELRLSP